MSKFRVVLSLIVEDIEAETYRELQEGMFAFIEALAVVETPYPFGNVDWDVVEEIEEEK